MMISFMGNWNRDNLEPLLEVIEDDEPRFVVVVDIGVSTDVNPVVRVQFKNIFKKDSKLGNFINEQRLFSGS